MKQAIKKAYRRITGSTNISPLQKLKDCWVKSWLTLSRLSGHVFEVQSFGQVGVADAVAVVDGGWRGQAQDHAGYDKDNLREEKCPQGRALPPPVTVPLDESRRCHDDTIS